MSTGIDHGEASSCTNKETTAGGCTGCKENFSVFTKLVLIRCLLLCLYCFDIISDVAAAYGDYRAGDELFAYITLGLVFAPGILFSLYMFVKFFCMYIGEMVCLRSLVWLFLGPFLPLWVILRSLREIISGLIATFFPSKREVIEAKLSEPSRVYLIKFLEAFVEAAPQLLVRLLRVASRSPKQFSDLRPTEIVQISLSILVLSFKVVSTHQQKVSTKQVLAGDTEQDSKYALPWYIQIIAIFWWICFLASRFEALALFSASYGKWVIVVVGIHVGLMFMFQTITAANKNTAKKVFVYLFGAFIFIFAYVQFNLKTRLKIAAWFPYTIFSIVVFVENSIMLTFWFYNQRVNVEDVLNCFNKWNATYISDSAIGSTKSLIFACNATNVTDNLSAMTNSSIVNNFDMHLNKSNVSNNLGTTIINTQGVINTTNILLQREDLQHHWEMLLLIHYGLFGAGLIFMIMTFCCTAFKNDEYKFPSSEEEKEEEEKEEEEKGEDEELEMEVIIRSTGESSLK